MLTDEIKQAAEQYGILDLAKKLYTSISAADDVYGVTFDFSEWELDYPCIKIIVRHHLPSDHTLRQRHRIVRPVEKIIRACGLLQTQGYGRYRMDKEYLIFYYRLKTKDDYTLYPSDFGYGFVPTTGELQQLQTEFAAWDGDKEAFTDDFHNRSRESAFFEERGKEIARLLDQLSETEKRHSQELAAKDRLIADLRKALEKARNS